LNIGIFTDTYHPQINGVVTSVRMLEEQLRALGHTVYVFTVADPKAEKKRPYVYGMPSMALSFIPSHRVALLYPPHILFKFRALKLDVIHTQSEFPLGVLGKLVSGFYRIPMVHTYHTMYVDYVHYIANGHLLNHKTAERYSRIFCNGANMVVAPTSKVKECLLNYKVKRPIEVVPTGFDFKRFARERYTDDEIGVLKDELGIPRGAPVLLTVSRLAREKNIDVVIKVMPKILADFPEARYVITGDGPLRDELAGLAETLGLKDRVVFTGAVPWDDVGKFYRLGDCFVSASTSETQGLTYAEAMASRAPVAAKKDESIRELLVDGETGFLFDDEAECAAAIKTVLSDKNRAAAVAERAYESVGRLSCENFGRQIEAIYKKCIEERPKRTVYITVTEMIKKAATYVIDLSGEKQKRR